jgi:hypothetical protein
LTAQVVEKPIPRSVDRPAAKRRRSCQCGSCATCLDNAKCGLGCLPRRSGRTSVDAPGARRSRSEGCSYSLRRWLHSASPLLPNVPLRDEPPGIPLM